MQRRLNAIGVFDNKAGRKLLKDHLIAAYKNPNNIKSASKGCVTKGSLLMGPDGGVVVESAWKDDRLITIILKTTT